MKGPEGHTEKLPDGGDPAADVERGAAARRRRNRYGAVAALFALASAYGLFLDDRLRADPFTDSPGLWVWLSHKIPHHALEKIPVVPVGARGTLTFRPQKTAWINSPYQPGRAPDDAGNTTAPPQASFPRSFPIREALAAAEETPTQQQIPQQQQQQIQQQEIQQPIPQQQQQQIPQSQPQQIQQQEQQQIQQLVEPPAQEEEPPAQEEEPPAQEEESAAQEEEPPAVGLPVPTPSVGARPDGDAILDARCLPKGDNCWIGGEGGRVAVTRDGGATWQEVSLNSPPAAVWSLGGEMGASTLTALLSNWQDFKSSDGGLNWSQGDDGIWVEGQAWALDSGLVWLPVIPPLDLNRRVGSRRLTTPSSGAIASVAIPMDGAFRIATPNWEEPWRRLSLSVGVGKSGVLGERFIEVASDRGAVNINALLGVATDPETEDNMWLLGDRGFLARITTAVGASGASTAVAVETGTLANLRDIYFQDNEIGWAVSGWFDGNEEGDRPAILQTLDGGATWQRLAYGHLPAPWSFAAALAFAFALFGTASAQIAYLRAPKPRFSIADQAAPDDPIGWEDVDALGLKRIARALSKFLRNRNTDPSVVFGISGPWGTGKSSLMNLVAEDLKEVGCRPVAFNAWHHQKEEHLLAALLENIRAQAIPSWWRLSGLGFRLHLFVQRFLGDLKDALALAVIAVLAAATLWLIAEPEILTKAAESAPKLLPGLLDDLPTPYREIVGALGLAGTGGVGLYLLLRAALRLRALPASPAALMASFARYTRVAAFQEQLGFRYNFAREFGQVCRALRDNALDPHNPGMVIFIDDLDRCRPENVLDVLEAVNFLATAGPCFIFLGIDEEKVISSVAHGFKDSVLTLQDAEEGPSERDAARDPGQAAAAEEERSKALLQPDAVRLSDFARNYLEKLINITVPVPPATATATAALLNARLPGDAGAGTKDDDAEPEAARPVSPWPRRLRRFVRTASDVSGVVVPAALLLAYVVRDRVGEGEAAPPPELAAAPAQGTAGQAPADTESATPATVETLDSGTAAQPLELPDLVPADQLGDGSLWFIVLLLAAPILALAFAALLRVLGRREDLIEDTEDFRLALGAWNQVIFTANPTPRGVKRYQNRLRFLAMRARGDDSPLDWIEKLCRRLGLRVRHVDSSEASRIGDLELVTLGAIEAHDQSLLDLSPAEIDSRFRAHLDDITGKGVHVQFPPDHFRTLVGEWPPRKEAVESYREYSRSLIARAAAPAAKVRESA